MTGYGKAEGAVGSRKYTVEVRSLNGKNLDLSVRMPSVLKEPQDYKKSFPNYACVSLTFVFMATLTN